ncbi:MAG: baseplate J/gp47 family protein [Planctomycetes bacterium]|nr:baseplate J/gp47 family protein [Planctomycetota bacterium]
MSLPLPQLDDRRFADLAEEARSLITRYCPEWTDHNVHDPGITLLELFAWLVDAQLYRLERVPVPHRESFARLIGLPPREARPARMALWPIEPERLGDGFLPANTSVASADDAELRFATVDDVFLTRSRITRIFKRGPSGAEEHAETSRAQHARFLPFGASGSAGRSVAIRLEPVTPAARVDLWFQLADAELPVPEDVDPEERRLGPAPALRFELRSWHAGTSGAWDANAILADGTLGFTRSGSVALRMPAQPADAVELRVTIDAGRYDVAPELECVDVNVLPCVQLGVHRHLLLGPGTGEPDQILDLWQLPKDELRGLRFDDLDEWPMRVGDLLDPAAFLSTLRGSAASICEFLRARAEVAEVLASATPNDAAALQRLMRAISAALGSDDLVELLRMGSALRGEVLGASSLGAPTPSTSEVRRRAWAAFFERLGTCVARIGPIVETEDREGVLRWVRVDRLRDSAAADAHFEIDRERRLLRFGDGVNGRVPPRECRIRLAFGATCVGAGANLSAMRRWTVESLATPGVWTNRLPARGGRDRDTPEELVARAQRELRQPHRTARAEDVERLALATPGVAIARAFARFESGPCAPVDGANVVVLIQAATRPESFLAPLPATPALIARVESWLRAHRLLGQSLRVLPVRYVSVSVRARLVISPLRAAENVHREALAALDQHLAPLRIDAGRFSGRRPGEHIAGADLLALLDSIDGVEFASDLEFEVAGRRETARDGLPAVFQLEHDHLVAPSGHVLEILPWSPLRASARSRGRP